MMHVNPPEASYISYNIVLTLKQKVHAIDTIKLQLPNYPTHMVVWHRYPSGELGTRFKSLQLADISRVAI